MGYRSQSELSSAERELNETNGLVHQQYGIVKRLKRLGADSREAILLLLNLLDLQQSRERRLSYLRMRGTDPSADKFNKNNWRTTMTFERHRDKNGEIGRKHGNTLIRTLRRTYGRDFAFGCGDSDTLRDVLHKLDEPSLSKLVRDHEAGKLDDICSKAA